MSVAIDTNVLVRLLVRDDEAQFAAALRLVTEEAATGMPVLILLCTLLETEWVLRSRMKLDRLVIADAFVKLLESTDFSFSCKQSNSTLWALISPGFCSPSPIITTSFLPPLAQTKGLSFILSSKTG